MFDILNITQINKKTSSTHKKFLTKIDNSIFYISDDIPYIIKIAEC